MKVKVFLSHLNSLFLLKRNELWIQTLPLITHLFIQQMVAFSELKKSSTHV